MMISATESCVAAIALPAHLAAKAGQADVYVVLDEDTETHDVYAAGARGEDGWTFDPGARLRQFTWTDYGEIRDLFDRAKGRGAAVNTQALARIGRKKRWGRGEDNKERAPDGAKYEET